MDETILMLQMREHNHQQALFTFKIDFKISVLNVKVLIKTGPLLSCIDQTDCYQMVYVPYLYRECEISKAPVNNKIFVSKDIIGIHVISL